MSTQHTAARRTSPGCPRHVWCKSHGPLFLCSRVVCCWAQVAGAARVLGSLSKLLEELPNLETPDVIGDQVGQGGREGGREGGSGG
jgi:hypothetical protein